MYHSLTLSIIWLIGVLNTNVAGKQVTLPAQLGPYPVSINDHVVYTKRTDPWSPKKELRKLMITIYKPDMINHRCVKPSFVDYMPASVAAIYDEEQTAIPDGTFEKVQLRSCKVTHTSQRWWKDAPLILFSPGLGQTRLAYSAIMLSVASSGYTVIGVDHTYAPRAVEFPNGELAIGNRAQLLDNSSTWDDTYKVMQEMMPIQATDLDNVLEAVKSGQLPGLPKYTDKLKLGMFGQSLGGAEAAYIMANDSRYIAGVNYDGPMSRGSGNPGFNKPWMNLGEEYLLTGSDASWDDLWSQLTGWKTEFAFNHTMHETFTDIPLIMKTLNIRKDVNASAYEEHYGSIDGKRVTDLMWKYTVTFFDFVFKKGSPALLQRNSTQYPEAVLIRGDFK